MSERKTEAVGAMNLWKVDKADLTPSMARLGMSDAASRLKSTGTDRPCHDCNGCTYVSTESSLTKAYGPAECSLSEVQTQFYIHQ